jgi:hypothetical protein
MEMAESHVVSALANKRAEIAGMIARAQQQLGQFRADLVHLDATIRLFAPAMEPETIPPKRIRQSDLRFEAGGLSRRVLDALRRAGAPIRAPDLVRAVMIDTGLDPADRASFVRIQWKVTDTLSRLDKRGLLAGSGVNKPRAAPGNAGVRRRLFYYAASTAFQMAGAPLPLRRSLRRLNCPFRIRRSSSIPAIVTAAVLNHLNPSIGPMRDFTPR